jgi:hypothetical protein
MSEEFRIMGFRELEKFYEENGYYADQDPRNAMNFFDTCKRRYRGFIRCIAYV